MSEISLKFDFSDKMLFNRVYLPILKDTNRYIILYGGRDSAKSYFAAQMTLLKTLGLRHSRLILLRKYFRDIMDSQYQTISDLISDYKLKKYFKLTRTPLEITCLLNGNKILARGLDKPENTKSIKDPTGIWYEEADEIGFDEFINSSLSLRTSKSTHLQEIITFNPSREHSWINRHFFPDKHEYEQPDGRFNFVASTQPNTTILHTTYRDNSFCSPERGALLESLKLRDENYYKVYALGLWGGALKGLIFPDRGSYSETPAKAEVVYGLDTGFNNPSALIEVSMTENEIYARELLYQSKLTPAELSETIKDSFGSQIGQRAIYVDSADPATIEELRKIGMNAVAAEKGPDSVYKGIMTIKKYNLFIHEDSENLKTELNSYIWQENHLGEPSDQPVKMNDHAIDAMRYAVTTHLMKYDKYNNIKEIYSFSINNINEKNMKDRLFTKKSRNIIN